MECPRQRGDFAQGIANNPPLGNRVSSRTVAAKLNEAAKQARRYGAALRERYGLTELRTFAVVALGFERVVWRAG
jgi:hypothetical protein